MEDPALTPESRAKILATASSPALLSRHLPGEKHAPLDPPGDHCANRLLATTRPDEARRRFQGPEGTRQYTSRSQEKRLDAGCADTAASRNGTGTGPAVSYRLTVGIGVPPSDIVLVTLCPLADAVGTNRLTPTRSMPRMSAPS